MILKLLIVIIDQLLHLNHVCITRLEFRCTVVSHFRRSLLIESTINVHLSFGGKSDENFGDLAVIQGLATKKFWRSAYKMVQKFEMWWRNSGTTGHYRVQAPPWVSPQGSLDTTGSRRLHGSAPGGHWTLPGSGPSLGQPPGEGRPPVHTTSCHVLFPGDALSHFLAKNASERGVVTGWPLVWKTWKCQGIWQLSGKCRGFH